MALISLLSGRKAIPETRRLAALCRPPSLDEVLVHKLRRSFVWAKQYFEVDDFIEPRRDYQILEISCAPDLEIKFPPFIEVIQEITGDPLYVRL